MSENMIRQTYRIHKKQVERLQKVSMKTNINKSRIVRMGLNKEMDELESRPISVNTETVDGEHA